MRRLPLPAALLIALSGGAAGFLGYRLLDHHHSAPPLASGAPAAPVESAPAAMAATSAPEPTVPATLPEVRMPDLNGRMRTLSEFAGGPRIINFWATWCGPCRREIPLLNTLQHDHKKEKLQVVGIAIDFDKSVREYVKSTKIDYPVFIGEDAGLDAAQKFGISDLVLPFSVFADAKDRVVAVKIGELHPPEAEFILKTIRELDLGHTSLEAARAAIESELNSEAQKRATGASTEAKGA